jgi:Kef-type K+ transport system membrane component KefB
VELTAAGHVVLALGAMLVLGRVLAHALRPLGQPPVIAEVLAGIALGPSLLGALAPSATAFLLPASAVPALSVLAQVGVVLYMFVVGLELDVRPIARHTRVIASTATASIVVPFVLGVVLAGALDAGRAAPGTPAPVLALFVGVALSITAFPVLARILQDLGLTPTPLAVIALSCAALNDVAAWCLLAAIVGVARAESGQAVATLALTTGFAVLSVVLIRPWTASWLARRDGGPSTQAVLLLGAALSAWATYAIGVHALFGAFLFGGLVPHDHPAAARLARQLATRVTPWLLPAFFALTGMRTSIGALDSRAARAECALIVLVATAGKVGGTMAGAWWGGLPWRQAAALGALMNTRGLMELIVLNVGLDLGLISPTLFTMMVVMALVTTLGTAPLLSVFPPAPVAAARPEPS